MAWRKKAATAARSAAGPPRRKSSEGTLARRGPRPREGAQGQRKQGRSHKHRSRRDTHHSRTHTRHRAEQGSGGLGGQRVAFTIGK